MEVIAPKRRGRDKYWQEPRCRRFEALCNLGAQATYEFL
jgi:hypothetical protein